MISLPQHRIARLANILAAFSMHQCCTSVKRWHETLGKLWAMSLALPGSQNIFSLLQNAMTGQSKGWITPSKEVHDALDDFQWMHAHITSRPTCIAEVIPFLLVTKGHHNTSGLGAGSIWFPCNHLVPHKGTPIHCPSVWQHQWLPPIMSHLVTESNPTGSITNSDLACWGPPPPGRPDPLL